MCTPTFGRQILMKFPNIIPFLYKKQFKTRLLPVTFFAAIAFIPLFVTNPGYLSVDEGTYHMMAKNLADGSGFEIWNGYREFPSRELISGALVIAKGRLVAKPPDLFTVAALPFYMLFKYRGLFFLNAVAFLGILAITYHVARRSFGDSRLATNACLILALSTYLWDYSQAAWPHATSTLFIMAAFYAMMRAFYSENHSRGSIRWALAAGLLGGLALGVRLDAAFALPALLIPMLFTRPPRWSAAFATGLGLLPGLITLSLLNHDKFGTFSPFSYGRTGMSPTSGLLPYLTPAIIGFLFVLTVWVFSRSSAIGKRILLTVIIIGSAAGLINLPEVYGLLERLATGAAQLVIDLRFRSLHLGEPGLGRTATGGLVYIHGLKKSLLQSCPYLVALVIPLAQVLRRGRDAKAIKLLLVLPACFIGVYSYFAWHGGQCLNLRYFVPVLPFAAMLAAYAWRELAYKLNRSWLLTGFLALIAAVSVHIAGLDRVNPEAGINEFFILSLPLYLAGGLAVLSVIVLLDGRWRFKFRWIKGPRTCAAIVCLAAMVWAGSVVFFYDYPLERAEREDNYDVAARVGRVISDDSIIFVSFPDPYFGLIEKPAIRIAVPKRDRYRDFGRLADWHLSHGRPVYASFKVQNAPKDWIIQDISGTHSLYRIRKAEH